MPNFTLNTKTEFDKSYAWEALQQKFFQQSLDIVPSDTIVELSVKQLRELSDDSHEYGRIRERTLHTKLR